MTEETDERRQPNINTVNNDISEMKVDIKYIQRDLSDLKQSLKDGSSSYASIKTLETLAALYADLDKRTRVLERYGAVAVTLLAIAQILIPYVLKGLTK